MQQSFLTREDFLKIAIQILEILSEIHKQEIIHQNLTPHSIWIDSTTLQIKITDFSLSLFLSEGERMPECSDLLKGYLAYISPEQTGRMNRLLDYRTDFYSLGIIFYEILAQKLPFSTKDPLQLIHCHIAKNDIATSS
ncbi:MAG: protein kinase [Hydrococcus sp. RM1_1_31]|nr:protein kinase [Hydrococcus sp. RM1_1_31]